jgi:hypothetical protein
MEGRMTKFGTTEYVKDGERWLERHVSEIADEDCLFRVDVSTSRGADYATNGLRWKDQEDAHLWAVGLMMRWFGATNIRVVREADNEIMEEVL